MQNRRFKIPKITRIKLYISLAIICSIAYSLIGYDERGTLGIIIDLLRGFLFPLLAIAYYSGLIQFGRDISKNKLIWVSYLLFPIGLAIVTFNNIYSQIAPFRNKIDAAALAFLTGVLIIAIIQLYKLDNEFRQKVVQFRDEVIDKYLPPILYTLYYSLIVFLIWLLLFD
jgi:hypothetical protein